MGDTEDPKKIYVCDPEPVTVAGVRALLEEAHGLELAGAGATLAAAMEFIRQHSPAAVLIEESYGLRAITDCLNRLRREPTAAIVWSAEITEAEAVRLVQAGARGIIRKTAELDVLLSCMRAVAAGQTWMEHFHESVERRPRSTLTMREMQVVELVERGLKNKEIAACLGIRPGTVQIHLRHIFEKTGVRGRYTLAISGIKARAATSSA